MKPACRQGALAVVMCVACGAPVRGQMLAFAGAGALVPTEAFASVADVGWAVTAGVRRRAPGSRLSLGLDGFYGRAAHGLPGERSALYGGGARIGYTLYDRRGVSFEVSAALDGLVHAHKSASFPGLDASRSGVAAGAAATVWTRFGDVHPFVQGGYVRGLGGLDGTAFPTRWAGVNAGLSIPLG